MMGIGIIIGLFILHWFVHYRLMLLFDMQNDGETTANDRKLCSRFALVPVIATITLVGCFLMVMYEKRKFKKNKENEVKKKRDFLKFTADIGTKQFISLKEKRRIKKEKIEEEKNNYTKFDILEL